MSGQMTVFLHCVYLIPLILDQGHLFLFYTSIILFLGLVFLQILLSLKNSIQSVWIDTVYNFMDNFADNKDKTSGSIFLLTPLSELGSFIFAQYFSVPEFHGSKLDPVLPLISIMTIGIGDSAASIIGSSSKLGRYKITSYSNKSYIGVFSSIVAQMMFVILYFWKDMFWMEALRKSLIAIVISSFCEGLTFQTDNLLIPPIFYTLYAS